VKNTIKLIGIIALLAATAFSMAACDSGFGGSGSSTDSRLNGTWVGEEEDTRAFTFNNGNYEVWGYNGPDEKGTYTTTGNSITMTMTHYYGYNDYDNYVNKTFGIWLAPKWYSRAELRALGAPEDVLIYFFSPETATYSISGNILYLTYPSGNTYDYTRK
jgi:hypothetical protein